MINRLRLLDIRIRNYPLFEKEIDFSLLTSNRVAQDKVDSLNHLYGNNYTNNITTIVGKNATGKTTIMKLEMGILYLLFGNKSINETGLNEVLFDNSTVDFDVFLYGTDGILIKDELSISQIINNEQSEFVINKEKIYIKKALLSESKKDLLNFEKSKLILDRNHLRPEVSSILSPDDSLFKSLINSHGYKAPRIMDNTIFTNSNRFVSNLGNVPTEILNYLDPSIEYLKKKPLRAPVIVRYFLD
jgi:ABC-type Mn/Zn transport systems, ATPase component